MKDRLIGKKVGEIMQKDVFLANLDHSWSDVARKMSAKNIHHIVVVDENHAPLTVLSSFDFLIFAHPNEAARGTMPLRETLTSRRLVTVRENASMFDAMNEMNNRHVESVVVVNEEGRTMGIITPHDIMNLLYEELV